MAFLGLILLSLLFIIPIVFFSVYYGISPMPSSRAATEHMKSLLPADFTGIIYDLGSGFGTLAYSIAKSFPNATIIGFEISPLPLLLAKVFFRRKNLRFFRKDFFTVDLTQADYLLCYLYPGAMQKLEKRPYKRVISNTFSFYSKEADRVVEVSDLYRTKVYLYASEFLLEK